MATFNGTDFKDYIDTFFYDDLAPGYYGEGSDIVYGYGGDDLIYGYEGHDDLDGGFGHDTIYGGSGDDNVWGGDDDDYLSGGDGADDLYGFCRKLGFYLSILASSRWPAAVESTV